MLVTPLSREEVRFDDFSPAWKITTLGAMLRKLFPPYKPLGVFLRIHRCMREWGWRGDW